MKPKQFNVDHDKIKKRKAKEVKQAITRMTSSERRLFLSVPDRYKHRFLRGFRGELSPRQAIKMNCLQCQSWTLSRVTNCTDNICPLHSHRPTGRVKEEKDE